MAGYFQNFPLVDYKFGDETSTNLFQQLNVYVDIVDQVKNDVNFYEEVTVLDGERPEALSYRLYETTDYYWSFFLLNDEIRLNGWPLTQQELDEKVKEFYPHNTVTTILSEPSGTTGNINRFTNFAEYFTPGKVVLGSNSLDKTGEILSGTIIDRNLTLLQLIIQTEDGTLFNSNDTLSIRTADNPDLAAKPIRLVKSIEQYNAIHHYEIQGTQQLYDDPSYPNGSSERKRYRTAGTYVDLDWPGAGSDGSFNYSTLESGKTPITNRERLELLNDSLKQIKALKPNVIAQIFRETQKVLRTGL